MVVGCRGAWTTEEDLLLLGRVAVSWKKWSEYAVSLRRTEHTVKNRYNSLLIKQKKLTPQFKKEERLLKELTLRLQLANNLPSLNQAKNEGPNPSKRSFSPQCEEQIVQESPSNNSNSEGAIKFEAVNSSSN
jgi:hypothetical protein